MQSNFYQDYSKDVHNEDYIASGILELYAAGGLTEAEREEVERQAAQSPEIRSALDEACAAMEAYAGLYAHTPKSELKTRIMNQLANEEANVRQLPIDNLREPGASKQGAYQWMLAASVALMLFSGILSVFFYSKWQQAEERLAGVMASERLLAQQMKQTSLRLQQQQETLAIVRDPDFELVKLKGVQTNLEAALLVYWNPDQAAVYIDPVSLPTLPTGKQYQLWALLDGQPIDAGMIELTEEKIKLQQMKHINAAQAFAVTVEPVGGSATPTLETITVMGKVGS
ncbi:Anti-sigma-K factor RskA [Pontibacter indicus]|uniref:Regulator of SigK n=1 Tax=Pontibacter indicus TaxID=1317125 RepID=A0A1R3WJS6_9BACT|nr:Anti-sigma-K factor RskA [Pontibacter indicus]